MYTLHHIIDIVRISQIIIVLFVLASAVTSFQFSSVNNNMMMSSRRRVASTFHANYFKNTFRSTLSQVRVGSSWSILHSSSTSNGNEYLVQARLAVQAAKKQSRKDALEQDRQRNLRIKRMLHSARENNEQEVVSPYAQLDMYAIRVSVDKELRQELKMNGREKRGRVFVEVGSEGSQSLKGLKFELHSFFRCLKKSTFLLSAGLPTVLENGSIFSPGDERESDTNDSDPYATFWPIETDEDVMNTFDKALEFYKQHNEGLAQDAPNKLKRPSILIHVSKNPNAPPPPPVPKYLTNMANPKESESMAMLSFYSFPKGGIDDPEEFSLLLRKLWKPFDVLGRVYVAREGVNAQMSVPTNVLENFRACCFDIPELGTYMENGINVDPIPLTMEEFAVAGDMDGKPCPPFKNLHIRVRQQIVADGLDKSLNWESAGYDMPPMEWHEKLKEAREKRAKGENAPLIFDCRNSYETSVGSFVGAEGLETESFRDSWEVFKDKLKDTPKDTPIMTYCTGGIRCVKVGAYLTQEMGFTNVSRLAGGIIAYDRTINESAPQEEMMFKGTNYVFDGRVGRQITDDALADCMTCDEKTNLLSNCKNTNCHKRMIQCATCRDSFVGTCSEACKNRVLNSSNTFFEREKPQVSKKYETIEDYSLGFSTSPSNFFDEIKSNTAELIGSGLHMLSDSHQGRVLAMLASNAREGRVLEIGGFTGYATCCFLEGSFNAANAMGYSGQVGSRNEGPFVMSLERDSRAFDIAVSHVSIMSKYGIGNEGALEASKIRSKESHELSDVLTDSVSFSYGNAGCEIVKVNDALAHVEAISKGLMYKNIRPFDIVFIDADKTRFLQYVEACLVNDKVLKRGGIMIVDNTLWKGLVVDVNNGSLNELLPNATDQDIKKSRRARKLATAVHEFNRAIVQDDRVEVILIPMRDGLDRKSVV